MRVDGRGIFRSWLSERGRGSGPRGLHIWRVGRLLAAACLVPWSAGGGGVLDRSAQAGTVADRVRVGRGSGRICAGAALQYPGPRVVLSRRRTTERVAASLHAAGRARDADPGTDELHDEIGGHFSFDRARQARCEAATHVQLGRGREAEQAATAALELYAGTNSAWRLIELEVGADLAAARLLSGDLDGAQDALTPIWDLPPHERREGLTHRARQVGALLARPAFRRCPPPTSSPSESRTTPRPASCGPCRPLAITDR